MNTDIKRKILDKIKEYDRIIIARHIRPDGDAVGSTQGLKRILSLTFPQKEVYLINEDYGEYTAFLGKEDDPLPDEAYREALMIAVDTATADRISNKKYTLAKEIVKIDHHVDIQPFGDLSWVEEDRAAAAEMIADFYLTFPDELKIDSEAATCIYAGIVTDSGRFRYGPQGQTLRCAAAMLDIGVDTETLYSRLYLEDFAYLKFRSTLCNKMKMTENGVAYIYVDRAMQEKFHLTREEASESVSALANIKGCLIWIAFIDNADESIRVRLRSRFVTVNKLAEKYHGGGHACAAGATAYSRAEMRALIRDADALLGDYKANNEGWL